MQNPRVSPARGGNVRRTKGDLRLNHAKTHSEKSFAMVSRRGEGKSSLLFLGRIIAASFGLRAIFGRRSIKGSSGDDVGRPSSVGYRYGPVARLHSVRSSLLALYSDPARRRGMVLGMTGRESFGPLTGILMSGHPPWETLAKLSGFPRQRGKCPKDKGGRCGTIKRKTPQTRVLQWSPAGDSRTAPTNGLFTNRPHVVMLAVRLASRNPSYRSASEPSSDPHPNPV